MGRNLDPRLSWNVKAGGKLDLRKDRHLSRLQQFVLDACGEQFPNTDGYQSTLTRLSGPIDGITVTIARGDFRALISTQRYARSADIYCDESDELRLVACAGSQRIAEGEREAERLARSGKTMGATFGFTTAMVFAWSLGASIAGIDQWMVPFSWHGPLLLLPALLLGCLITVAGASLGRARARGTIRHARKDAQSDGALQDDMKRWRLVLRLLEQQREIVAEQITARPFRSAGQSRWALSA